MKWEDAASYLVEYQVPAADVLRKMEDVQLHDDGIKKNVHFQLKFVFVFLFFTLGLGVKVFSFLTALVLFFYFLSKDIRSISRFSHLELKCSVFSHL